AESIENNVDKIQRIADNRKQFIDNMSHEMKTPLTSIMCLADVLRIKRSVNEKERREYAGIIVEEAKRLKGLSEKLLELSIADNAQLEFEEANIKDILGEIYLAYSPVLQKRNMIMVISEIDAFIRIDKELFKSMLFNLIDNAQKASEDGQAIRIKCAIVDDDLVISISDEGIGMSKLEIKKITEPFYMVDKSRSRKSGGAGLGLSLCISIAKCHNANLSIKSIIGKGTTVFLRIPTVMGDRSL
ncbi:MAG: HAMP domain-containing sensor histidine kinase, partial [Oscillospiraceae bacterium]